MIEFNMTLVAQLFTFLLLVYLLNRFLYGPITKAMNERSERIKSALEAAERSRDEARQLLEEYRDQMAKARNEAQDIIEQATQAGKQMREEIVVKAKAEAERTVGRALAEIDREKLRAIDELQSRVADLALMAAAKVVEKSLDRDDHLELIDSYLAQLDDSEVGASHGR